MMNVLIQKYMKKIQENKEKSRKAQATVHVSSYVDMIIIRCIQDIYEEHIGGT